jgi:hypothetical protein
MTTQRGENEAARFVFVSLRFASFRRIGAAKLRRTGKAQRSRRKPVGLALTASWLGVDPAIQAPLVAIDMLSAHPLGLDGRVNPRIKSGDGHDGGGWLSVASMRVFARGRALLPNGRSSYAAAFR